MYFSVKEHVVPTCHIREYPGATAHSQEEILQLHVKQYTPLDAVEDTSGSVTLIGTHAIGFPKEVYEPLWDELYLRSKAQNFSIRSIWIADVANLGQSSVLNEQLLGNDVSWMDHSRDLFLMVNHFRSQMPRPLVGLGHSFGACQITNLSLMHPRLFVSLILLDPGIQLRPNDTMLGTNPPGMLNTVTYRRDIWPSRKAAGEAFKKSPIFASWDQRVFERMMKYGLRELPTALYPETPSGQSTKEGPYVTLTTTKHQEAWSLMRPNFDNRDASGRIKIDRSTHADLDPLVASSPFYRPEPRSTWYRLPELRPSVLFLTGGATEMRLDEIREGSKIAGTGVGGSGGVMEGRVKEITLPNCGHLFPMQRVNETAESCATWLGDELQRWRQEERVWQKGRAGNLNMDNLRIDEAYKSIVKPPKFDQGLSTKTSKL